MTKTTTVPHLLEQLSVELHANGVKFDTAQAFGVPVTLTVRYEAVGPKYDTAHVVIEKITIKETAASLFGSGTWLDIDPFSDITHLVPKSQVAAIEENLLAQMAGE